MIRHSLYGKIVIVAIFIIVPLTVILYYNPEALGREMKANDLTIIPSHDFTAECSAQACIYNISSTQSIIKIEDSATAWTALGDCVDKTKNTYTGGFQCVSSKIFSKALWNIEQRKAKGDSYTIFSLKGI